jgi:hypothetical protein
MPDQLVGGGYDVHRGTALGSASRGLGAAEQYAELPGLGQEDALGRFSQPGSLKFGCVHDHSGIDAGDGNGEY